MKEELIRAWIGEKNQDKYYQKVMNGGFSWTTWLVPDLHLITRKMYIETYIYILVVCIITFLFSVEGISENIANIIILIIRVIMGFIFYPLYKRHIFRKIRKYEQQGLSYEEQLNIAKNYGGDKITIKTIIVILIAIIEGVVLYVALANGTAILNKVGGLNNNYSIIENENGINTLSIDDCKISYDSNKWQIMKIKGKITLQYNGEECYVVYNKSKDVDTGIENFDTMEFREEYEEKIKDSLKVKEINYVGVEYNTINSNLKEIVTSFDLEEYDGEIYVYGNDSTLAAFVAMYKKGNYKMSNEVRELLRTIQLDSEESTNEQNIESNTNTNSVKETVGRLTFTIPEEYEAEEYNTNDSAIFKNNEIWSNIYINAINTTYYESIGKFAEEYIYDLDSVYDFENENINGTNWRKYVIEKSYTKKYYYLTEYEDKFYLVEFIVVDEEYENTIIENMENIKKSFKLQ